jgi:hypothetical protein
MLLSACSSSEMPNAEPDAGDLEDGESAEIQDAGEDGADLPVESADEHSGDLWGWCPDASAYIGGEWMISAVATDEALYCVVNQGTSVEEAMRNKAQLRFVPGTYPLPAESGDHAVMIPACIWRLRDEVSQHEGVGNVNVTAWDVSGAMRLGYELSQPMRVGDKRWDVIVRAMVYFRDEVQPTELVMSDQQTWIADGKQVTLWYFLGVEGFDQPWGAYPCEPAVASRREIVTRFDRGNLTVEYDVYMEVEYGGQGPAQLRMALGELDGVSFEQRDYARLSHQPAHHNWGGSYLVLFDEPIGQACGIKLHVPSEDGGGPELGAWTVDCDLAVIDELGGLEAVQP